MSATLRAACLVVAVLASAAAACARPVLTPLDVKIAHVIEKYDGRVCIVFDAPTAELEAAICEAAIQALNSGLDDALAEDAGADRK